MSIRRTVWLLLLGCAVPAAAQPHQESGIFVDAGAFASVDFRSRTELPGFSTPSVEGGNRTAGGLASVGVFLQRFLSVRADVVFTGTKETVTRIENVTTVTSFSDTLPTGTVIFGEAFSGPSSRSTTVSRTKHFEVHALLAYHLASSRRARVAVLAGPSFVRASGKSRREEVRDEFRSGGVVFIPRSTQVFSTTGVSYSRGTTVGLEAEAMLAPHVSLASRVALTSSGGTLSLRPQVAVRWSP